MGYWNSAADGSSLQAEDTGIIWGDQPADILDDAIDAIVSKFTEDVGRVPTRAEMEAGWLFSISTYEDKYGNPE